MTSSEISILRRCAETLLKIAHRLESKESIVLQGDLEVLEDIVKTECGLKGPIRSKIRTPCYVTARNLFALAARRLWKARTEQLAKYLDMSIGQINNIVRNAGRRMAQGDFFTRYNNITYQMEHHGRLVKPIVKKEDSQPISNC